MERNWCRGEVLDPIFYHPSTIGNDNPILNPIFLYRERDEKDFFVAFCRLCGRRRGDLATLQKETHTLI
jgi:hypothetical protein